MKKEHWDRREVVRSLVATLGLISVQQLDALIAAFGHADTKSGGGPMVKQVTKLFYREDFKTFVHDFSSWTRSEELDALLAKQKESGDLIDSSMSDQGSHLLISLTFANPDALLRCDSAYNAITNIAVRDRLGYRLQTEVTLV